MHEKAIEKIEGRVRGSLKRCEVTRNWPQYDSFTTHVDSLSKEVLKHKGEWLSITDVYSIYYDLVYEAIIQKVDDYSGSLDELLSDEELGALIEKLTQFFVSIPRNYSIFLPLPNITKDIEDSIELTESLELVVFKKPEDVPGGYHRNGLLGFVNKFDLNKVYLKVTGAGYFNNNLENKAVKESLSKYKILIQQGVFKGLFRVAEGRRGRGLLGGLTHFEIPKYHMVSVDQTDDENRIVETELPIDISKYIDSIDFNWLNEKVIKPYEEGKFDLPLKGYWRLPSLLIESDEPESTRVKSAVEWCFDSMANENETISFLQICIGLESILGDSESNGGLTDMLADRCAYLISSDIKGREGIRESFRDLYKIRSKLVHGVTRSLKTEQKKHMNWGKIVLELAIIKEIKHLHLKQT